MEKGSGSAQDSAKAMDLPKVTGSETRWETVTEREEVAEQRRRRR
jgi:hypothetical protein